MQSSTVDIVKQIGLYAATAVPATVHTPLRFQQFSNTKPIGLIIIQRLCSWADCFKRVFWVIWLPYQRKMTTQLHYHISSKTHRGYQCFHLVGTCGVPIRVWWLIEGDVNNSQTSVPVASMSYLLLIVTCFYNPRYVMYIILLSFGIQWCLFEGGYYYCMLTLVQIAAAIRVQLQFEVRWEFEEIWYFNSSVYIYSTYWIKKQQ